MNEPNVNNLIAEAEQLPPADVSRRIPILDQRTMHRPDPFTTPEDMHAFWVEYGLVKGFPERRLEDGSMARELAERPEIPAAYIDGNRWVADCPACGGGLSCWTENPHGCCLDCGSVYEIAFPAGRDVAAAVDVLLNRPPRFRTWNAHRGETIDELKEQNLLRGLPLSTP